MTEQPELDLGKIPPAAHTRGEGEAAHKATTKARPEWTRVKTAVRPKCLSCVMDMENGGKWRAPNPTVWCRTVGDEQTFYCWSCGATVRQEDGLVPKPKNMGSR